MVEAGDGGLREAAPLMMNFSAVQLGRVARPGVLCTVQCEGQWLEHVQGGPVTDGQEGKWKVKRDVVSSKWQRAGPRALPIRPVMADAKPGVQTADLR